jgi:hypothetical protein
MALTKIGSIGINTGIAFAGVTTIATLNGSDSVLSVGGTVNFVSDVSIGGTVSIAGTLTYEDVTNVDAVGLITARDGIKVGSGITLSPDGDIFFTGIITGNGSGLTNLATDLVNDTTPQLGGNLDTFTRNIFFGDSNASSDDRLTFGAGTDLSIYHDGTDNYIDTVANKLYIRVDNSDNAIVADTNGSVELYHSNSKKLETTSGGVTVTGTVAATSYTGDGSSLTGISVGITTEAYVVQAVSGITTFLDLSKDDHKITASGITTVDVRGGTEGDSHTLRIENSGITTVGFSTYFLFPSGGTPNLPTSDGAISLISFTIHRAGAVGLATQLLAGSSVNFS